MRSRLAATTVAATVLLLATGCYSEDPMPAPDPAPASTGTVADALSTPSPAPVLQGPAAQGARWPDGVTARLVAVERVPSEWAVQVPPSMAVIRLTLEVTNGGPQVLPIEPQAREMALLYGPNREEGPAVTAAPASPGADGVEKTLDRDGGTQLPVGGTATFVESQMVPVAEIGALAVAVELPSASATEPSREAFTLTGVEQLLRTVS